VHDHRRQYPIQRLCAVLGVAPSGYYAWRKRPVSAREMANRSLLEQIKMVHKVSHQTYGSPRIHRELRAQGYICNKKRVARLMRKNGIQSKQTKAYRTTTNRNKAHPVAPNLVQRQFEAERPDQIWLSDISYIPTWEGWLYLAAILDMCSRRVVGWSMSQRATSLLTRQALDMALQQRRPSPGLILHSDQGSQYTDGDYQAMLSAHGLVASMNAAGTWYDNAPMESFFGTLKSELVHRCDYRTRDEARVSIFEYIETFYNPRRLHSSLGYMAPDAFERLLATQSVG
jgi:putative transposase